MGVLIHRKRRREDSDNLVKTSDLFNVHYHWIYSVFDSISNKSDEVKIITLHIIYY